MKAEIKEKLDIVKKILTEAENYAQAGRVLAYDQETICPPKGMERQGEVMAFLNNQAFKLIKSESFIEASQYIYENREELDEWDKALVEQLHRDYLKEKNITPEKQMEFSLVFNKAFVCWSEARKKSDFSLFSDALSKARDASRERILLRDEGSFPGTVYDQLLDDYERGITSEKLDECFGECKERLLPLLEKIKNSKKKIRRDFLSIEVNNDQQIKMSDYLIGVLNLDMDRGAYTTSEHPFTEGVGRDDIRITTHYYPTQFYASMYSIIHEGGHALFESMQPGENYDHFITSGKTLGMHESVSRMYENRIGRSREFVKLIYPKTCELFPQVMKGVSEEELYEGLNIVEPTLIRTEADEFTYTFHIIIRYEIERELFTGQIDIADIPRRWNEKYREYLGIEPKTDREGVLQDVHWTFGFGYFPTYAIGNMYNAMYYNRMKNEIDIPAAIGSGNLSTINNWMKENVFLKADRLSPDEWIRDITGRELTADDFLNYLEEKYSALYEL